MKLFLILIFMSFKVYSATQAFEAIAKYEGKIAYVERHTVTYDDKTIIKSLTEYLDPEGKLIATMTSDYTHNLAVPEFIFRDLRQHNLQGVKWTENKLEVFSQEGEHDKLHRKKIATNIFKIPVSGQGLIYFISANLERLISKKKLEVQYIIPGRLEAFDFCIKIIAHNKYVAEFEVEMKSWFMRLFGPRLKLIYDIQKKRLILFKGLSHLRDSDGKMMSVDIQYKYQD